MNWPRERQVLIGLAVVVTIGVAALLLQTSQKSSQEQQVAAAPAKKKPRKKDPSPPPSLKAKPAPAPAAAAPAPKPAAAAAAPEAAAETEEAAAPTPVVDKKQAFDDANRLAQKYYKGSQFEKAAEYFTKCIDLIDDIPEYMSKLQLLYNNRSAMYEKLGEFDKSLADITVLLTLNKNHSKSRIRRARIWESQGKLRDALKELFIVLAQVKDDALAGKQIPDMSSEVAKLEELVERITAEEVPIAKKAIEKYRGLPAKYLLKQFFASFKEYRDHLERAKDVKLEALVQALHESREESPAQAGKQVEAILALVLYYTSVHAYVTALEMAQQAREFLTSLSATDKATLDRVPLAQLQDAVATYLHLNNDLAAAGEFYREALKSLDEAEAAHAAAEESSTDVLQRVRYLQSFVNVKYGALLVDADQPEEARQYYDRAVELDPDNMDVYVHRSQLWHSLKEPEKSQADLETAVAKDPTVASSYVRLAASCLMSDLEQAVSYLQRAKELAPNDANVASAEVEILFVQSDVDRALEMADRAAELDPENPMPLISKATIFMQVLQMLGGQLPTGRQITHDDLLGVCNKILEIDPNNETAYSQKGQVSLSLATTPADMEGALSLFDKAISVCRTTEDLPDLLKYQIIARAQIAAARENN